MHTTKITVIIFIVVFLIAVVGASTFDYYVSPVDESMRSIYGYDGIWEGARSDYIPKLYELIDNYRIDKGLGVFLVDDRLEESATNKAKHMVVNDYWAHTSYHGPSPWDFMFDSGYRYKYASENLAKGEADPFTTIESWLLSNSHRELLESTKFEDVGIGVECYDRDDEQICITVLHAGSQRKITDI